MILPVSPFTCMVREPSPQGIGINVQAAALQQSGSMLSQPGGFAATG
jgi:hypothetical protein